MWLQERRRRALGRGALTFWVIVFATAGCDPDLVESPPVESTSDDSNSTGAQGSSSTAQTGSSGDASTSGAESSGSTGHPAPSFACEDRSECVLHSDCCGCQAMHVDEPVPACDQDCNRTACEQWGITEMLCSHTCLVRLVECNADKVTCTQMQPPCEEGFRATVEERCWTGRCVPAHLCRP